jgi:transcriptional regulator with XRE-family HTH domain
MKFKDKYNIGKDYEHLFSFRNEKDELDYEAHMLMFRFLSEIQKINSDGKTLKNKDLASKLGVSPSYITQLFNGTKMLNFTMLAKIQKAFNITFEIKASKNSHLTAKQIAKKESKAALYVTQLSDEKTEYKKLNS